jgi:hypothetical protein
VSLWRDSSGMYKKPRIQFYLENATTRYAMPPASATRESRCDTSTNQGEKKTSLRAADGFCAYAYYKSVTGSAVIVPNFARVLLQRWISRPTTSCKEKRQRKGGTATLLLKNVHSVRLLGFHLSVADSTGGRVSSKRYACIAPSNTQYSQR